MALRINTNVSALNAHRNMIKNDSAMAQSLERLSTGLRINKAADDASGMAIADALKAQSLGLGQAIRNANDGISIVQTADGALDEAIKIVNTIKTKAIQAAQDGQTLDSRKKIQADIDKLLQEVDIIAKTTSFNGKKLLSGEFANKKFQVGATAGETVSVSIDSAEINKVGHVSTSTLTVDTAGSVSLKIHSNIQNADFNLQAVDLQYNNSKENGIGALADAVNKMSDQLGVTAQAVVESDTGSAIQAGSIGSDFQINGVEIGAVTVQAYDSDGSLASAINGKTDQTGVKASVDGLGVLTLSTEDGRAIEVEGTVSTVFGKDAEDMSTFGEVRLTQKGANSLVVSTSGTGEAIGANLVISGASTLENSMTLAKDSTLATTSTLAAGTVVGFDLTATNINADVTTTQDALIKAGSVLESGSILEKGTVFGGDTSIAATGSISGDAYMTAGSTIGSGSTLAAGTVLSTDIVSSGVTVSAGTTLTVDTFVDNAVILEGDMTVEKDSQLTDATIMSAGSYMANDDATLFADSNINTDFTMKKGSVIESAGSVSLAAGSTLGGTTTTGAAITVTQDMTLAADSIIADNSTIGKGSTLGFDLTVETAATLESGMELKAGTVLGDNSILKKGTYLTTDIVTDTGGGSTTIAAGTTLEQDITLNGSQTLTNDMVLAKESTIAAGTVIAENGGGGLTGINLSDAEVSRLFEVDVTSQEGAQTAISIADAALSAYDGIRAGLGSTQNQLTSTIANLSVTQSNVSAAESNIRDVDFAAEAQNFSKLQILSQTGAYAMSQANASAQVVMSLLQ